VGQLEESLKAFKSIDASTLKNLKEISKLNSVVADAKWTETHEKYQRAKYDTGGASADVEYKKWQTEKLKREEKYDVTLKLYKESRHEILKDFCKNEVISDIISFI
jgi:esterase/lipase